MVDESKKSVANGCYTIVNPDGSVVVETSELRAYKLAVHTGGKVEFTRWGCSIGNDVAEAAPAPRSAKKAAAPKPSTPEAAAAHSEAVVASGTAAPPADY